GAYPDRAELGVTVDAGAVGGKPVYFRVTPTGTTSHLRAPEASGPTAALLGGLGALAMYAVPLGLAAVNLRHGRGDRPGAMRLAAVIFGAVLLEYLVGMHHTLAMRPMWYAVMTAVGGASATGVLAWLCYVAIEPIIRRQRPAT